MLLLDIGERDWATYLVTVPVLEHLVLAHCPEIMTLMLERNLHNAIIMREYRPVTISKV